MECKQIQTFIPAKSFLNALKRSSIGLTPRLAPNFLILLLGLFSLNVEGSTNPLHRFAGFEQWHSLDPEDRVFGAAGNFFDSNLAGRNSFILPRSDSVEKFYRKSFEYY